MITEDFLDASLTLIRIGVNIRRLREVKQISQQDLAAACNFEKSNMSRIESGRSNVTIGTLQKIATALEVELVNLVKMD
jgi:transcriptional regulator with XRE-family HTH domain